MVTLGLVAGGGVAFASRGAIVERMDDWLLLPRPQRLTELYFARHRDLPKTLRPGATEKLAFVVHNLEHRATTYHYELVAVLPDTGGEQVLGGGVLTVASDGYEEAAPTITVPLFKTRAAIKIVLSYEETTFDKDAPSLQTESIHFWADLAKPRGQS